MSSRRRRRRVRRLAYRRTRTGGVPWGLFILLLLLAVIIGVVRVAR